MNSLCLQPAHSPQSALDRSAAIHPLYNYIYSDYINILPSLPSIEGQLCIHFIIEFTLIT